MFSSFFGKRRSSPVEDETPPIPGHRPDEGFEIINPSSGGSGLYPNPGGPPVYPMRPAPPAPMPVQRNNADHTFHYLQGVPFQLSKQLQMSANKNAYVTEVNDMLAFLTSKVSLSGCDYNFSNEKSVLKECD